MMSTLGYEEMIRLNQERVRRSIQRQRLAEALAGAATTPAPRLDCEVIEVDFAPAEAGHRKLGA